MIKNKNIRMTASWEKSPLPAASKFAERFQELLEQNNINQTSFGKKYGIPNKTISNWCVGTSEPSYDMLIFICKEFKETADYMLGLVDS